jgi:putative methionine-R-sulfoxide reductase with GAF domain
MPAACRARAWAALDSDSATTISGTAAPRCALQSPTSGALLSLFDKQANRELVDTDAGLPFHGFVHEEVADREREDDDQMTLVCREPKPACSPIGLHGMCGRGMLDRRPLVIADVRTLGPNYIACDPKDQSELVIPLLGQDGSCDAVLDVDSWDLASFDDLDAAGMTRVLLALGLTSPAAVDLRSLHL